MNELVKSLRYIGNIIETMQYLLAKTPNEIFIDSDLISEEKYKYKEYPYTQYNSSYSSYEFYFDSQEYHNFKIKGKHVRKRGKTFSLQKY